VRENYDVYDVVVVGSGAAGLSAALRAAELGAHVAVLTAGSALAGSSPRAQGGIAAAVASDDAPALHAADTLSVGAGLNDRGAVAVLTRDAPTSVQKFGELFEGDLGLEAGHARRRILHAGGGATGQVLSNDLIGRAKTNALITLFEHAQVSALQQRDGRVVGARTDRAAFWAGAVILATGGYAALWHRSTNAHETRGSGLGLAWQAGASLADLEFVQFHPTALSVPGRPALLLSEALRGEGARLVNAEGVEVVDPLLPRDVLARALYRYARESGPVFLSLKHLDADHIHTRFARLAAAVRDVAGLAGVDLARDLLPVAPAAHYCMGGVRTDTWGRTDVAGLYAAGEVACSGVQGANRLASNSLLECLVFGARAAEAALTDPADARATWTTSALPSSEDFAIGDTVIESIGPRRLGRRLDEDLGVERDADRLQRLVADLPAPDSTTSSGLLAASLVARSALLRAESRGAHYRTDAPTSNPAWRGRVHWRRGQSPVFEEVLP
jgi:L-aspartate oxidase